MVYTIDPELVVTASAQDRLLAQISKNLNAEKERSVLDQLNTLISQKILMIEETSPVMTLDPNDASRVVIRQKAKLICRDQERIEELVKENEKLKERLRELTKNIP